MLATLSQLWGFFRPFLKPYKMWLFGIIVLPVIWCLVETIAPFLIKIIIDRLASDASPGIQTENILMSIVILYMVMVLILELTLRGFHYIWIKTFPHIRGDIQSEVLNCIQMQDYKFFYNQLSADVTSRYRNLTDGYENIAKSLLYGFYPALLSFIFSLAFIAYISAYFSVIFLFWFVAMTVVTAVFSQRTILASQEHSRSINRLVGYIGDFIGNAIALMTFSGNLSRGKDFTNLKAQAIQSTQRSEWVIFKADTWRSILSWFLLASMILYLGYGWQEKWITLGDFSFIATVCFYVRRTIWMTSTQLADFFQEVGAVKEALTLIKGGEKSKHSLVNTQEKLLPFTKSDICFSEIRFGYNQNQRLFDNLNLEIPFGQKVGIAGASGIGKTSLIHLLLRLHDPDQGTIRINGKDYREYTAGNLRDAFSYVPQNAMLFHSSIYDNIKFGNPEASSEAVYEAAQTCLCDDFIQSLENGYETIVGEGGYKLSGGQRQRIAIARAYLKKAPVFVLDEATSALDMELEEKLLNQILQKLKDHTIILISHRTSTLKKMDRIVEFGNGQIVGDNFLGSNQA